MTDDAADRDPLRRHVLEVTTAGITTGLAGCLGWLGDESGGDPTPDGAPETTSEGTPGETTTPETPPDRLFGQGPTVDLETVATGLRVPTDIVVPESDDRTFVADQYGPIYAFDPGGETPVDLRERDPFLDLSDQVVAGGEAGLLGLEFHPDFAANGRLFVRYSAPLREEADDLTHREVLAEFHAPGDRTTADPGSERILLEIPQPHEPHNSGDVLFGPDGYLYVPTGDGIGNREEDAVQELPFARSAQNTEDNLLGGMLRIDVDAETEDRPYGIPDDNPLVDREGHRDEYYAWGFRNPWGVSFDGDDLYAAIAGDERAEWVDLVEKGGNYGWAVKEGTYCAAPSFSGSPPEDCIDRTPRSLRGGEPFVDPIVQYPREHEDADSPTGIAMIGGYVYRGSALPGLQGEYVFGDLQGHLFAASPPDDEVVHPYYRDRGLWPIRRVEQRFAPRTDDAAEGLEPLDYFLTVTGNTTDGELYLGKFRLPEGTEGAPSGNIYRVVPATDAG